MNVRNYEKAARNYKRVLIFRNCKGDVHASWHEQLETLERSKDNIDQYEQEGRNAICKRHGISDEKIADYLNAVMKYEKDILSKPFKEIDPLPLSTVITRMTTSA